MFFHIVNYTTKMSFRKSLCKQKEVKWYNRTMNTQSEVFFAVSSVGFVVLWILVAIFLIYLIRMVRTFSRIIKKIEENIDDISDTTKDMFRDMRDSIVFRFLFGKKRRGRK